MNGQRRANRHLRARLFGTPVCLARRGVRYARLLDAPVCSPKRGPNGKKTDFGTTLEWKWNYRIFRLDSYGFVILIFIFDNLINTGYPASTMKTQLVPKSDFFPNTKPFRMPKRFIRPHLSASASACPRDSAYPAEPGIRRASAEHCGVQWPWPSAKPHQGRRERPSVTSRYGRTTDHKHRLYAITQ